MQLRLRGSEFNSQIVKQQCNYSCQPSSFIVNKVCNPAIILINQVVKYVCNYVYAQSSSYATMHPMSDNYQEPGIVYQQGAEIAFNPLVSMVTVTVDYVKY